MTFYHMDSNDARIKLYPRRGVKFQFIPRKTRSKLRDLERLTEMPDLLQQLDHIRKPRKSKGDDKCTELQPDVVRNSKSADVYWLDISFCS